MYRIWNFVSEYSLLLVGGALAALLWANTAPDSYHHLVHLPLWVDAPIGMIEEHDGLATRVLTLHFLINDMLMALFFAIAAKEVWEAVILSGGSLRGKKALTPLIATLGGMAGPVLVYLALAGMLGVLAEVGRGWAIPTATDIAFSYLVGRIVFGARHPAIGFLLLLAIADDAGGLAILAIFYPTGEVVPMWLLLSLFAAVAVWFLACWLPRRLDRGKQDRPNSTWMRRNLGAWPYVIAGCISWYAFYRAGLHPALGLLPIVPTIPHAERDFGIFAEVERHSTDLLNTIEHALKIPVQLVLCAFGLVNAGVEFGAISAPTWLVLAGLVIGKPLGITLFGWFAANVLHLGMPEGMSLRDLPVVGFVAAIGFTVALFVASVAFPAGPVQDAAKMGALFSLGSAVLAILAGRIARVRRLT
ncbi:Na+/H+ antiporter NhaA [Paracoccus sp. P2]|uniref:Na(+)/H(+) antiporter NhaA n=1 Tax=Paracoccus pantotrophus TaxID=82367 RepID=A0A1I5P776_PARPN|nr:Na+/H+ antiporter NhaA [Paracoccus pantotrophus]MDF3856448.1 Na+/H+ antiporter NhaA [Paracoccus pantotrophus]QFG34958.1 Na+/H+ antiporter NhaA [Paracoccus pantotrophus]QLH13215.1 Na+/H+ antiporter NhaA [Paracoccus pantotrophus]RDD97551.1 sodium:proton antiporter [Paracoccus pantotrophus]RKS44873.1 sodium/proton antiporter (NhaA family) [Paracoccus pantotrophus]